MEYLIVMGFIFAMIIPLTILFLQEKDSLEENIAVSTASKVLKEIIDVSEEIYYKGEPSKTTIKAYFPDRIDQTNVSDKEITFYVRGRNGVVHPIIYPSLVNLSGTIKTFEGVHNIEIEAKGEYILITDK